MLGQAFEPFQLIVKFWTRLGIAIWQVDASDQNAVHCRFNVTALCVLRVTGQLRAGHDWLHSACKDGDTVPRAFTLPDRAIASLFQGPLWKAGVSRFEFLQANNVWFPLPQPRK